jgi:hypothetical protein
MSKTHAYFENSIVQIGAQKKVTKSLMKSVTQTEGVILTTPEQKIAHHLEENGQSIAWLARKVGFSRPYLHNVLKSPEPWKQTLTPDLRHKINAILKTDY